MEIVKGGDCLEITPVGGTDFDCRAYFPAGLYLTGIELMPSAGGDTVLVREGGAAGPVIARLKPGKRNLPFALALAKPYIAAADCTLKNPAAAKIILRFG